jgi:hypothetical protein
MEDAVLWTWYVRVELEPIALMNGIVRSSMLKDACCALAPMDGRVSTTVRFPLVTVVLTILTLGFSRLPAGLAADPMW